MDNQQAAFGVFRRRSEVRRAKAELQAKGFSRSDIAILFRSRGVPDFRQKQKEVIEAGAIIGAIIGGLVFMVIGIITEMKLFSSHPMLVLGGFIGCVILGAASGALVGIGTPKSAARRYGDYVDSGGILMSVHVDDADEARKAQEILDKIGAQEITLLKEDQGWKTVYDKLCNH